MANWIEDLMKPKCRVELLHQHCYNVFCVLIGCYGYYHVHHHYRTESHC